MFLSPQDWIFKVSQLDCLFLTPQDCVDAICQSRVEFSGHLKCLIHLLPQLFPHHKAFVRVNYKEEPEKNVDGDDFQGVQNKHSDLHVAGTVEACSRLT